MRTQSTDRIYHNYKGQLLVSNSDAPVTTSKALVTSSDALVSSNKEKSTGNPMNSVISGMKTMVSGRFSCQPSLGSFLYHVVNVCQCTCWLFLWVCSLDCYQLTKAIGQAHLCNGQHLSQAIHGTGPFSRSLNKNIPPGSFPRVRLKTFVKSSRGQ